MPCRGFRLFYWSLWFVFAWFPQECSPGRGTAPPAALEPEEIGHQELWFPSLVIFQLFHLSVCCELGVAEMIKCLMQTTLSYLISALRERFRYRCRGVSERKLNNYLLLSNLEMLVRGISTLFVWILQWEWTNMVSLCFLLWRILRTQTRFFCLQNKLITN